MNLDIKVKGLRELNQALANLKTKTAPKRIGRKVLKEAAEPVARHARSLAPVDFGNLRESITVTSALKRRQKADRESLKAHPDDIEMSIGPAYGANYTRSQIGSFHEFGTWFHPATPFMRPAWEAEKERTLDRVGVLLDSEITKATAREAARAARLTRG